MMIEGRLGRPGTSVTHYNRVRLELLAITSQYLLLFLSSWSLSPSSQKTSWAYASQEVSLAWGAQLEQTKLKETLSTIKLVHKDAEKKQLKNPLITHWLGKLKDVCHDVDDVLDELEFQKLRKKMLLNNHGCVKGQVRHFFSRWNPVGGLGKTTFAKLVYNDNLVERNFETRMWICVSDNFDIQTLVRGITSAAGGPQCGKYHESLDIMETKLQQTLRGKKFLLVLDDVWDTESIGVTREKWIALKPLLNVGGNGSKIIVTTRNNQVASIVNSSYKHSLEGLPHKDCMSLFIQRAFKKGEEHRYQHLIEIGDAIVKKCGGVPLAVSTLENMLHLNTDRHR
ncbi:hypothetical protein ACLB2K_004168 [Fragaria x ananassa]